MRFLVIGAGIGRHHAKNLKALGHEALIYDIDQSKSEILNTEGHYDAFVICTPPDSHLDYIKEAVNSGVHIFVEKPIGTEVSTALIQFVKTAEQKGLIFQVGYNLRFSTLHEVKKLIDKGTIGRVICLRAEFGQWLPDWRPSRNYMDTYTAQIGIISDASHEIDYVRWIMGKEPEYVTCHTGHYSELNTPGEDMAELVLDFGNALASIHVDYIQQGYTRKLKVIGTEGQIEWTYPGTIRAVTAEYDNTDCYVDYDIYRAEMIHFIDCIRDGKAPLVDGVDAIKTLEVVERAKMAKLYRKWY